MAREIGITIVHLHARDGNGDPTYKAEVFEKIINGLRKHAPELVICVSLSGRNFNEFEKRSEVLELLPDMGSLTLSSMNFIKSASVNDPEMIQKLANKMLQNQENPELEVFDLGMIHYSHHLIKHHLLQPPFYFNIITGNVAGIQTSFEEVGMAVKLLPRESFWAIGGIGPQQLKSNVLGILGGGGLRIGIEDNIYFDRDKKIKASNQQFLERIHHLLQILDFEMLDSTEFGSKGFYNPAILRNGH
jgi:3-keto-5-aminohexanoate cleavage enzyme